MLAASQRGFVRYITLAGCYLYIKLAKPCEAQPELHE